MATDRNILVAIVEAQRYTHLNNHYLDQKDQKTT